MFYNILSREVLERIDHYPNYLSVYYSALIAPGLIGLLTIFLVFVRNEDLRKLFVTETQQLFVNAFAKIKCF